MAGFSLTPGQMSDIRTVVRAYFNRLVQGWQQTIPQQSQGRKTIALAAAAAPATNASTTPTSVSAYVLEMNSSGNLVYKGDQITVFVIWEGIETIPQYALGKAVREHGRWELDNADCDALSAATRTSMGLP